MYHLIASGVPKEMIKRYASTAKITPACVALLNVNYGVVEELLKHGASKYCFSNYTDGSNDGIFARFNDITLVRLSVALGDLKMLKIVLNNYSAENLLDTFDELIKIAIGANSINLFLNINGFPSERGYFEI